ncbi:hypothetical protein AB0K89_24185 [Streptomyces cinnamoneus]|uniref:hypothetical protein n=1 Tax=Streptomyces cinnamoneus TaxID=53446 RepID=UPI00342721C3
MSAKPVVVIVDAYATARHLIPLFWERGYDLVHVQGQPSVPPEYAPSFRPSDFRACLVPTGDGAELLAAVAGHRPVAVLAGAPSGADTADALAEGLGLRTNGTRLSAARRERPLMAAALRAAEVRGAGRLLDPGKPEGLTYHLNTVSLDGLHYLTDVWTSRHPAAEEERDPVDGLQLLPCRGAEQDMLAHSAFAVLDALGVHHGPARTRFELTPEGPRPLGAGVGIRGVLPVLARQAIGESQLEWTVDAHVAPERFRMRAAGDYVIRPGALVCR